MTSGYVIWPTEAEGFRDSHEGGLWAYAFWIEGARRCPPGGHGTDFDDCHSPAGVISLPVQDVISHDRDEVYDRPFSHRAYPTIPRNKTTFTRDEAVQHAETYHRYFYDMLNAGVPVLGAICLGSTNQSLFNDDSSYFEVRRSTLTEKGIALIDALEELYGRPTSFVTYLDT